MFHNLKQEVWCSVMTWRDGIGGGKEGRRYMYNYG